MQKLKTLVITAILILFLTPYAGSLEWQTANQITIGWDAVTTLPDGDPLPVGNTIKYNVYLVNSVTDPDKTNPVLLNSEPISELRYTMTLNTEGKFFVGVTAVRYDGAELVGESTTNYSDINGVMTPNPFGVRYYVIPNPPANLHVEQP